MNFQVNLNGDTAEDIQLEFLSAYTAACVLEAALRDVYATAFHGRNYQTLDLPNDAQRADQERLTEHLKAVKAIIQFAEEGRIHAGR